MGLVVCGNLRGKQVCVTMRKVKNLKIRKRREEIVRKAYKSPD